MAKDKKNQGANHAGKPTGSYSSYGTSGYGYGTSNGAYGGASYGGARNPYGNYGANNVPATRNAGGAANDSASDKKEKKRKVEKVDLPDKANMSGKQKKLAKKAAKFDETDLRCYPMTVRGWIGTFILLAIPFIGSICTICWFFGVGNKSRTSWIRSYVVIVLLIVLLFGILFGVGFGVLSKNAKNAGYEGVNGTLYYAACSVVDMLEDTLGGPEATAAIKEVLAEKLGLKSPDAGEGGTGGESGEFDEGGSGGAFAEGEAA
ncbi:MAG: hypothetical protein K2I23_05745 [Clostridia bacterium]|nr:hypothetical protein [Clostridia bacterium]